MKLKNYFKWASILSVGGVLFAGYLSGLKLFFETCALNEPCPYFLGLPACYYGFIFFLVMAIASLIGYFRNPTKKLVETIFSVSLAGIVFAGYFVFQEMTAAISTKSFVFYTLGLPSCFYGFIFYIVIFVISYRQLSRQKA